MYTKELQEGLSFTSDWYRDLRLPGVLNDNFVDVLTTYWSLADIITDPLKMKIILTIFQGIAMTDGTTLYVSPIIFAEEFYTKLGIEEPDCVHAALMLVNGVQIHEAYHSRRTPECKLDKYATLTTRGTKMINAYKNLMMGVLNIVEDVHIESWGRLKHPVSAPFVTGTRAMLMQEWYSRQMIENSLLKSHGEFNLDVGLDVLTAATNIYNWDWLIDLECKFSVDDEAETLVDPLVVTMPENFVNALSLLKSATDVEMNPMARVNLAVDICELLVEQQKSYSELEAGTSDAFDDAKPSVGSGDKEGVTINDDGSVQPIVNDTDKMMDGANPLGMTSAEVYKMVRDAVGDIFKEEGIERLHELQDLVDDSRKLNTGNRYKNTKRGGTSKAAIQYTQLAPVGTTRRTKVTPKYQEFAQSLRRAREYKHVHGMPNDVGRVIPSRLFRIATDGMVMAKPDVNKKVRQPPQVTILLDWSGSMTISSLHVTAVDEICGLINALINAHIPVSLYAHTGDSSLNCRVYGVCAYDAMLGKGPVRKQTDWGRRLNALFGEKLEQNYDGYAIEYVSKFFTKGKGSPVVIVISDGTPEAGRNYTGETACTHTRETVKSLRRRGIKVISLSISPSVVDSNDGIYGKEWNLDASTKQKFRAGIIEIGQAIATNAL